jgi:hypothetical protein
MTWQPIETAPHGDDVLVFCPDASEPGIVVAALLTFDDGEGGEAFVDWHDVWRETELDVEPTHWMPLPSRPGSH